MCKKERTRRFTLTAASSLASLPASSSLRVIVGGYWKKQISYCNSSRASLARSIPDLWSPAGAWMLLSAVGCRILWISVVLTVLRSCSGTVALQKYLRETNGWMTSSEIKSVTLVLLSQLAPSLSPFPFYLSLPSLPFLSSSPEWVSHQFLSPRIWNWGIFLELVLIFSHFCKNLKSQRRALGAHHSFMR